MPVSPGICLAGYKKTDNCGCDDYEHKKTAQIGKQGQIYDKSNQIRKQRGHGCPDMFTGLAVSVCSIVCLASELLNFGVKHIGIRCCIGLFIDFYNDSCADCNSSIKAIVLKITLQPHEQKKRTRGDSDCQKQGRYFRTILNPLENLGRYKKLCKIQGYRDNSNNNANEKNASTFSPCIGNHPAHILH